MKILQVIDILNVGGAEKVFVDMCNILSEKNQDVTALFLLNGGVLSDKLNSNIPLLELQRANKWNLKAMKQCSIIIKKYDIIHCHFRHVYRYIALVKKIFIVNTKVVLHDHYGAIDIDRRIPFLFNSVLKPKYYIGVSKTLCSWANELPKISFNNIFLLENIIIKKKTNQTLLSNYDLIIVANIKKVKNNVFAVKLAKKSNKSLLLIGRNQDNNYYSELKNEMEDSNSVINSEVLEVQPILNNIQLGLHTSISETGPLVLIEYLAQGLPFLAYETGQVAKNLKPYFPEYFIDNFDEQQWVKRINELLETKPDIQKMEEVFEKYFGKEQYYIKLNTIYQCINN